MYFIETIYFAIFQEIIYLVTERMIVVVQLSAKMCQKLLLMFHVVWHVLASASSRAVSVPVPTIQHDLLPIKGIFINTTLL